MDFGLIHGPIFKSCELALYNEGHVLAYYVVPISARQNLNFLVACLSHQSIYLVAISHHITHFSKTYLYVLSKYFWWLN